MPFGHYNLILEERPGYLFAEVQAESISVEILVDYTNEILQRLREINCRRLLLLTKAPVLLPIDNYVIPSGVVRNAIPHGLKIAVVDETSSHSALQKQIADQGRALGLDLEAFRRIDAAERWLMDGADEDLKKGAPST
jgi:hypothetical protein